MDDTDIKMDDAARVFVDKFVHLAQLTAMYEMYLRATNQYDKFIDYIEPFGWSTVKNNSRIN